MAKPSPFLEPGSRTSANSLAIVQLSRDNLVPLILRDSTGAVDGYAEGAVLNTRFGSFPHSTLINVPWGSQIRASVVDTGSRGRKRKRKEDETDTSTPAAADDAETESSAPVKKAPTAASGFVHILQPTAELWTAGLPHRTQVVYTPDYSYILQRIRARPGTRLIEAGAGSGSFTHASARAVYNGYPENETDRKGKVFSFEFNKDRYEKMQVEIEAHELEGIVELSHRDVYNGGFLADGKSPEADSVFLDLPAPWDALRHLSRRKPAALQKDDEDAATEWISPLNPKKSVYICTFSPCIEQVQKTINTMRTMGWVDIDMVEISHKKFNVIRDRAGYGQPERGIPPLARDVKEAVGKLREIERRTREYHTSADPNSAEDSPAAGTAMDVDQAATNGGGAREDEPNAGKPWLQGRVIHRAEPELKTHTSYLVFAVLPREWSEEEEAAALAKWPCGAETGVIGAKDKETRKQEKREQLQGKGKRRKNKKAEAA
ncbi:tRNA methyltransferase complex GCD14 subunit [Colletotrichum graminicola]|uniref:tRNA (adenine(58)-N(1))-methyltransferase catalytic subunit TRM61 n=1 Tax=Colletotrichum graminicola (strain M1.001 / M2 / FGSC 10212) TaxID=645133 RepID=E3QTV3_COLGM|nr:tRNA methyltransferase complex GCD14 subunit [Colletotrichum graminicola M1.001]EFQ34265.1 tRNA methyltransferase complex GCD14 subunit [Colletotrichum graminicola M1.001]WDK12630.1 tRNA methyltransferase complex GCD14 subunit [Colletotrichum graminicola]